MSMDEYDEFVEEKDSAIQERIKHMSDTFSEYLLYLISEKNLKNVDVYKKAVVDKRQFSKIKNKYIPIEYKTPGNSKYSKKGYGIRYIKKEDILNY